SGSLGSASVRIRKRDRRKHLNVNEDVHKYARGYFSCACYYPAQNPLHKWQARRVRNSKTKFGTFGTRSRAVRGIWKALRTSRPLMRTRVLATLPNPNIPAKPSNSLILTRPLRGQTFALQTAHQGLVVFTERNLLRTRTHYWHSTLPAGSCRLRGQGSVRASRHILRCLALLLHPESAKKRGHTHLLR